MKFTPLLSIAIPAYARKNELIHAIEHFISQISGKYDNEIEILISDDHSPDDELSVVRSKYAEKFEFINYVRYSKNIGLEANLIACAQSCSGEFLWIFGDDDFPEQECFDTLMPILRASLSDFIILNRTRRSFDLSKIISDNWMKLDPSKTYAFSGLREFCLSHGFISIIGFISVNIFRRKPFMAVDASKYMGTMYPQLGAMVEAFHNRKTLLIGRPLVCHRTQTAEEKRAALGSKAGEADFMADIKRRNAIYFSHPYIRMLAELIRLGAFQVADIVKIPENTVINGLLIDFLIQTVKLSRELDIKVEQSDWVATREFFDDLPLDTSRRKNVASAYPNEDFALMAGSKVSAKENGKKKLTISVVSPSFNQAEFLAECLSSVQQQTYAPIEHLVFDPGSTDGSREIAAGFPHVTLFAESDAGQSDALNKGFTRASGDVIAWLNSDDCFAHSSVFESVIQRFHAADSPDIVYGRGIYTNEAGAKLRDVYINKDPSSLIWRFQQEDGILQPALFMKRSVIERVGLLRSDLHYCMDYEYWIRCVKAGMKIVYLDEDLAIARYHSNNKTYGMRGKSYSEVCDMMQEHFGYVNHIWIKRYAEFLAEGHDGVLAHAGNSGVKDESNLSNIYRSLLLAYNGSHDTYQLLANGAAQKGTGDTLREMKTLGIAPIVPCKQIPLDQALDPGCVAYTVGPRRWAFDAKWKAAQIAKTHEFFRERIANRRSETCVIVGNGPSLNKTDLSLLQGQDVIVSNNVFLSSELLKYATYFTVVNYLVAEQSSPHINRLDGAVKVLPYWMAYCLNPGPNTYFVDAVGRPEFSKDIFKNMSWRHTVTFFNLHLAYGLGYRKVIMIGFDHNYKQPEGIVEQEVIQSFEEDENHFHPGYFRGKKWQAADVDMMEEMYRLAKEAFEEDGRSIFNSTVGGKLELFPRLPLEQALATDCRWDAPTSVLGPFARERHAHWDETDGVANLFQHALSGSTMIDVGAHQGTALAPFLDRGWRIFAFEPDHKNRTKLLHRLANHINKTRVTLDTRCVSNKSQKGVTFFNSDQSTGISGLSAFHETHVEAQKVDITTLTEFFQEKPLPEVDFLKIDTEGYDLFVLQGFPWERGTPAVIECEFEDTKTVPLGYTFHDLARFLADKGYTVFVSEWHPIIRYGIRHDWRQLMRYPCDLADPQGWGNLLAFRDPIDQQALIEAVKKVLKVGGAESAQKPVLQSKPPAPAKPAVAIPVSAANTGFHFEPGSHFTSIAPNQWRFTDDAAKQKLWIAAMVSPSSTAGRTFGGTLRVIADRAMTINVSIGRHGKTVYEGATKRVVLAPGAPQTVQLNKQFKGDHEALKLQVEVVELTNGDSAELTVDKLGLSETLASIQERLDSSHLNLCTANRLFREGDVTTALGIYLWLSQRHPLSMYVDNIVRSAKQIGFSWVKTPGDLNWLLDSDG
ncbi:FkbM family methyltransferase [Synechococcus sp. BA-120 BA3]|nr:FkbM family methyltransferase [Synechococcus sp. BA-120 BA3]